MTSKQHEALRLVADDLKWVLEIGDDPDLIEDSAASTIVRAHGITGNGYESGYQDGWNAAMDVALDDTALLQQALVALNHYWDGCVDTECGEAIVALRERLGDTK